MMDALQKDQPENTNNSTDTVSVNETPVTTTVTPPSTVEEPIFDTSGSMVESTQVESEPDTVQDPSLVAPVPAVADQPAVVQPPKTSKLPYIIAGVIVVVAIVASLVYIYFL